eukprot:Lithocolla_globosa_v1_NODE_405_length_4144_cov_33.349474.p2 type:complete len:154 gc:universal NODE_405_length_4144_cov_33.349474:4143-3682(-)
MTRKAQRRNLVVPAWRTRPGISRLCDASVVSGLYCLPSCAAALFCWVSLCVPSFKIVVFPIFKVITSFARNLLNVGRREYGRLQFAATCSARVLTKFLVSFAIPPKVSKANATNSAPIASALALYLLFFAFAAVLTVARGFREAARTWVSAIG